MLDIARILRDNGIRAINYRCSRVGNDEVHEKISFSYDCDRFTITCVRRDGNVTLRIFLNGVLIDRLYSISDLREVLEAIFNSTDEFRYIIAYRNQNIVCKDIYIAIHQLLKLDIEDECKVYDGRSGEVICSYRPEEKKQMTAAKLWYTLQSYEMTKEKEN